MKRIIPLVAGCTFFTTLSLITVAAADPLESWTWRNPLPQGNPLTDVAFGNGTYVAVGPPSMVVTSTDGFHWLSQGLPTPVDDILDAVTYADVLFVGVGRTGSILTSADGKSWTNRSLNPFHHFSAVAYGNHRFVAVGQKTLESTQNFVTSEDGVAWSAGTIDVTAPLTGVTFGDGLFVAVGSDPFGLGAFATSPDGLTWTARDTPALTSVAYGNGRFVGVGGTDQGGPTVMVSTNGLDWVPQTVSGTRKAIAFGNGVFVATDGSFDTRAHVSPDGVTWQTHPFPNVEFAQGI